MPLTTEQLVIALFAVLIVGLMMPFSYAVRMGIFLALIGLVIVTLLGGGLHFVTALFD